MQLSRNTNQAKQGLRLNAKYLSRAPYLFLSCSSLSILCDVMYGAKRLQHLLSSLTNSTMASSLSMLPSEAHSFLCTEQRGIVLQ